MQQKWKSDLSGFTLIEIAIVVLILGILIAGFVSALKPYMAQKIITETEKDFEMIQVALSDFILDDPNIPPPGIAGPNDPVRYACPASLTANTNTPGAWLEVCPVAGTLPPVGPLAGSGGGVFVINGQSGGLVLVGAVPTATLGIPTIAGTDRYGHKLFYAVSLSNVQPNSSDSAGAIAVWNDLTPLPGAFNFVVVSPGSDGAGAYGIAGNQIAPCPSNTQGDSMNCSWQSTNVAAFRWQAGADLGSSNNYYDDEVIYTLSANNTGFWRATDNSGVHIENVNPGLVTVPSSPGVGLIKSVTGDKFVVAGNIRTEGGVVQVETSPAAPCINENAGSLRLNGANTLQHCNGTVWRDVHCPAGFVYSTAQNQPIVCKQFPDCASSNQALTSDAAGNLSCVGFSSLPTCPNGQPYVLVNGVPTCPVSSPTPVNGVCGTALNQCSVGTVSISSPSPTHNLWGCTGSNGGSTANCSLPIVGGGSCLASGQRADNRLYDIPGNLHRQEVICTSNPGSAPNRKNTNLSVSHNRCCSGSATYKDGRKQGSGCGSSCGFCPNGGQNYTDFKLICD